MKIVFMGTPHAAAVSLERLIGEGHEIAAVYTQPDRPSGRGNKITFSPVKETALSHGLPLFQPKAIRTPEALEEFSSLDADAAVVVAYGRILPEGFLNAFPRGAINVHFSLLPKYRGAAPVNWAIVNGETETGVTTMKMDAGLDTGDILLVKRTAIGADENAEELMERLAVIGADAIVETLERLGELRPIPQDNSEATFAPIMKRGDGEIDWTMSAKMIANRVRGFRPFPGTFSTFRGTKIGIVSASAIEAESGEALPGEIVKAEKGTLLAACGEHTILKIDEAKPEGKRAMSAADLINGMHPKPGERFGV
jgi:methionyl-tRNA formyltransferase